MRMISWGSIGNEEESLVSIIGHSVQSIMIIFVNFF